MGPRFRRNNCNCAQGEVNWFTLACSQPLVPSQSPSPLLTSNCADDKREPTSLLRLAVSRADAPPQTNTKHPCRHSEPRLRAVARATLHRRARHRTHHHARQRPAHRRARAKHPRDQVDPLRTHVRHLRVRFVRGTSENARKVEITPRWGK